MNYLPKRTIELTELPELPEGTLIIEGELTQTITYTNMGGENCKGFRMGLQSFDDVVLAAVRFWAIKERVAYLSPRQNVNSYGRYRLILEPID
jgi:hypothetical protein